MSIIGISLLVALRINTGRERTLHTKQEIPTNYRTLTTVGWGSIYQNRDLCWLLDKLYGRQNRIFEARNPDQLRWYLFVLGQNQLNAEDA